MLTRNEVKYIQSLYHKKNRVASGVFIVEGVKLVNELLLSDFKIRKIYAVKEWIAMHSANEHVTEVSEAELKKISGFDTPNKVLAVVEERAPVAMPDLKNKITLVLDGIQDPGNLGTIIRTADWFGIDNIIASNDTADIYNPKVVQSTMGSITRINIFYTDLKIFLSLNNITVYGALLNGENIASFKKTQEGLLLIGNEGKGIRPDIQSFIHQKIYIPALGGAESLNAAVATGIILWKLAACN
jgi:TrmH family RNA methyltransferase